MTLGCRIYIESVFKSLSHNKNSGAITGWTMTDGESPVVYQRGSLSKADVIDKCWLFAHCRPIRRKLEEVKTVDARKKLVKGSPIHFLITISSETPLS